jgi:putative transposase
MAASTSRAATRWRDALLLVKPETVLRWHRERLWFAVALEVSVDEVPAPRVSPDLVDLIRRMAAENRLWGAERIQRRHRRNPPSGAVVIRAAVGDGDP